MGFPQSVSNAALAACGRCCCICHKFCGTKMELHHIKQAVYGGEDSFENCIPLCLDCHAEMGRADPKHNKGKRYSEEELKMHRDAWYRKIANGLNSGEIASILVTPICDEDKALFSEICEAFDSNIQHELSCPCFYYPYKTGMFRSIDYLLYRASNPSVFFINQQLEEIRVQLYKRIDQFTNYLYMHTYSIGENHSDKNATHKWLYNNGYISGEPFQKVHEDFEKLFENEVDQINTFATELWDEYSRFVKTGRIIIYNQNKGVS